MGEDILWKMPEAPTAPGWKRTWLLALAALTVCGPWPGWDPGPLAMVAICSGLLVLARPRRISWLPWAAVATALAVGLWPRPSAVEPTQLEAGFRRHCRGMVGSAERLAGDEVLRRLLGAAGEAVDPGRPFAVLERAARGHDGRTVFLSDDRGEIIAWGGDDNRWPRAVRALGQRQWGVSWSAGGADLWLREPLLRQGRLIGTVLVVDRASLEGRQIWGMEAAVGRRIGIGNKDTDAFPVTFSGAPGLEVPVFDVAPAAGGEPIWRWSGWLLAAVLAVWSVPTLSWLVVSVGGLSLASAAARPTGAVLAIVIVLAGAAVGRSTRALSPLWSRMAIAGAVTAAFGAAVLGVPASVFQWLPVHLLEPGLGGAWMVALALAASAWPSLAHGELSLDRRLGAAVILALLGLAAVMARVPIGLERAVHNESNVMLPRRELAAADLLPAQPGDVLLDDLAPVLAQRWGLGSWGRPSQLLVIDEEGREVSRWGDLSPAGAAIRMVRRWTLRPLNGWSVELLVADEPWVWLRDWDDGLGAMGRDGMWYAVLTRSGEVAASLHPEIGGISAVRAGELYHDGGGWTWISVADRSRPARVWRRGQWLVAAVSPYPAASDWVVRTAIALLWALLGTLLASPPVVSRHQISTFGGRLRVLVAGGVVVPLVVLTLFLHERISTQESEQVQTRGLEALRAARYTATHLAGGVTVDDELARWLAEGWGGQVILWDGIDTAAVSRPDLVSVGRLPELPLPETFPPYLLGRDDATVKRREGGVVAAGPVNLQGRQLLLHLFLLDTATVGSELSAVDWLLTGALLSALLALVMTTRIQQRLSSSLRELVALARRLVEGQPVEPIRRPPETDLAEVLDAVSAMNEQVQRRERSLRSQEELLRITLGTLEPAVIVLEPEGSRRYANDSARLLEAEHGELLLDQVRNMVEDVTDGGSLTKTVQPIPGRDLTWQIAVAEVPLPEGRGGFVVVVEDVTGLVRADRARQLNELARIVAHEVKNPLTPVRLWVQELQAALGKGDAELRSLTDEACREIAIQVDRLQETANSFSNLVALEEWRPEPVDLASLVGAGHSSPEIFERRGLEFRYEISSPRPCPVVADRTWLQRALSNLLQNSINAIGDGPGYVTVRVFEEALWVVLEVEDSGGGVPDDRLADLFAPHFSTTNAGSGLGLALVHQVVTRCQGRVHADRGEHGLRVRLEFPKPSGGAVGS